MSTANVATKRTFLYIKEVADVFGITTKTVRHYHKIGLLAEPERSESDYRIYTGKDLWRLRTIYELRRLGLPLNEIRTVLAAPNPADALRTTLAAQLDEIETQLLSLATRKERIEKLMTQETLDVQQVNGEPELYVDKLLVKYADLIPTNLDESLIKFEREMEKMTAAFPQQDNRDETVAPMITYIEQHPEQYRQLMHDYNHAWQQLAEFGSLDADSEKAIARLADNLLEHNQTLFRTVAQASKTADEHTSVAPVLADVTDEKLQSLLTPAQQFFLNRLGNAADAMRADS